MDEKPIDWGWLPAAMPGVRRLMADKRRELGDLHVNRCWKHGVLERQPGWFLAVEGPVQVGTPPDDTEMRRLIDMAHRLGQPFLLLKELGHAGNGGAHGQG
jgi:hypothetical protein